MTVIHQTREQWLEAAVALLTPIFESAKYKVPKVQIACGFPSSRGLGAKTRAIGECWSAAATEDGTTQIFISPLLENPLTPDGVLSTLVHELVHAVVGTEAKHGPKFVECARKVGLEGPPKSCGSGPILEASFGELLPKLGGYPHRKINPSLSGKKKQGTRMRKCECAVCGYTVRTTKKWITDVGAPWCPAHGEMVPEEPEETEGEEA